jgi:hypothetical protein
VFIGYNSDTVASLILQLTTRNKDIQKEDLVKQVKTNLLKCATPDSVIRAAAAANNKDRLGSDECEFIWNEYFVQQQHLCLHELLAYHLQHQYEEEPQPGGGSLVQLTTHSKASLINLDLETLRKQLAVDSVDACLLESFDTQQQFLGKLKSFVSSLTAAPSSSQASGNNLRPHVLLIQGDMDTKYSHDLISCVRYQLVELVKSLLTENDGSENHPYLICLVVRMPKENVRNFIGFQLGHWSCYHMDEMEQSEHDLPAFADLKNKSLSMLLSDAYYNEVERENEINQIDSLLPVKKKISNANDLNLSVLFKKLAHNSCSLLVDTNLTRTISRIDLFIRLCDFKPFVWALCERLVELQDEKETEHMVKGKALNWLSEEAASLKQISQYSTLRRACQSYFETRLCPIIGYVLSFVDSYSNLDLLQQAIVAGDELAWKRDLWLKLFADRQLCRLTYASMRVDSKGRESGELQRFTCNSEFLRKSVRDELDANKSLRPHLPFSWLLVEHLNSLYRNFIESHNPNLALTKSGKIFDLSKIIFSS